MGQFKYILSKHNFQDQTHKMIIKNIGTNS